MTTTNFMQESKWQQRIHEALAMQSITDEDILALVEVIDANEHRANPEALTLAQTKGVYTSTWSGRMTAANATQRSGASPT